jgi:hypothetical protein
MATSGSAARAALCVGYEKGRKEERRKLEKVGGSAEAGTARDDAEPLYFEELL